MDVICDNDFFLYKSEVLKVGNNYTVFENKSYLWKSLQILKFEVKDRPCVSP